MDHHHPFVQRVRNNISERRRRNSLLSIKVCAFHSAAARWSLPERVERAKRSWRHLSAAHSSWSKKKSGTESESQSDLRACNGHLCSLVCLSGPNKQEPLEHRLTTTTTATHDENSSDCK